VALHRADGAVDVGDRLPLGDLADEDLAVLGEGDHARCGARTFGVGDDLRLAAGEHRDDGVGGAEVDSDRS
jgi:NAD-specific glutamate dehydrogenase